MIGCLSDWSTGPQLGCYRDSKQIRLTRPVKLIDLTAVPSTICLRHINIVHACMTQTLDWSKVDSLFSPIVMTDLDCHTVNLIDYIKVGQQNSKLPFHSCSHHGKKKKRVVLYLFRATFEKGFWGSFCSFQCKCSNQIFLPLYTISASSLHTTDYHV